MKATLLNNEQHRSLRVNKMNGFPHAQSMSHCPIMPYELDNAVANFPVVFIKDSITGKFSAVVLFGLQDDENFFQSDNAYWHSFYAPDFLRVYPFSLCNDYAIGFFNDLDYVSDTKGERLFSAQGKSTQLLDEKKNTLLNLLKGAEQTDNYVQAMLDSQVLVEFSILSKYKSGKTHCLQGVYTPDRKALAQLDDEQVLALNATGALAYAFSCATSLAQISNLVHRANSISHDPIIAIESVATPN